MIEIKILDERGNIWLTSKFNIILVEEEEHESFKQQSTNLSVTNIHQDHYHRNKYQQLSNKYIHRSNKAIKQSNHTCYKRKIYCSRNI